MMDKRFQLEDGRFLNNKPVTSPEAILAEFCSLYQVEEVKLMIWKLFKASLTSKTEVFDLKEEIGDMVFFLENFMLLQMAVFELGKQWAPAE